MLPSPSTSLVVKVNVPPSHTVTGEFLNVLILYSGPLVSSIMAMGILSLSLTLFIISILALCSSCEPCEKFNLAILRPALHIFSKIFSSLLAGPMVHTIFVFLISILLHTKYIIADFTAEFKQIFHFYNILRCIIDKSAPRCNNYNV